MAVVNWNEELKSVVNGSTAYVVSRQEYTVAQTSEIDDIDTTYLMQGSAVLDISTGKMHVWDGSQWVEVTSGGGGGGMDAYFNIKFFTEDWETVTSDKTFAELAAAVEAGKTILAQLWDSDNAPYSLDVRGLSRVGGEISSVYISGVDLGNGRLTNYSIIVTATGITYTETDYNVTPE